MRIYIKVDKQKLIYNVMDGGQFIFATPSLSVATEYANKLIGMERSAALVNKQLQAYKDNSE